MPLNAEHLQKPFDKLVKAVKSPKKLADPKEVHKLRTNSRRVEAALDAIEILRPRDKKQLLNALSKIRKSAGKVRDMDVLTAKVADLSFDGERDCQVRLLQYLGAKRRKLTSRLERTITSQGKKVRRRAKQVSQRLEPLLGAAKLTIERKRPETQAAARALALSSELQRYAPLSRRNLHEFRKEGKQLRYVLQMSAEQDDALVKSLITVQEAIGEWHDWQELVEISRQVLDHGRKCGLRRELQLHANSSFDEAIRVAAILRKQFFARGSKTKSARAPLRVVQSTAALAA